MMTLTSAGLMCALAGCVLPVALHVPNFSFFVSVTDMVCAMIASVVFPAAVGERVVDFVFVVIDLHHSWDLQLPRLEGKRATG